MLNQLHSQIGLLKRATHCQESVSLKQEDVRALERLPDGCGERWIAGSEVRAPSGISGPRLTTGSAIIGCGMGSPTTANAQLTGGWA